MRTSPSLALLSCVFLALAASAKAQQASSSSLESPPAAGSLLAQSLAAQTSGAATMDITLSGTVTFIHGAQTESGPMTLTALAAGTTKVEFDLPSGTRTEVLLSNPGGMAVITGSGPNGASTQLAGGSVAMPTAAWFSPALSTSLLSGPGYASSYIGDETRNGASVHHLSVWQTPAANSPMSAEMSAPMPAIAARQQTQSEIYLDPATSLPVSMVFQIRPYHKPGAPPLSIRARPAPEEVRFSNYQNVQGRKVPFHIQLFLGQGAQAQQIMDISISSATLNSGATIPAPVALAN